MSSHTNTEAILETLGRAFGFTSFRPHQDEIIAAILSGRDVFAALPTGGGKSLCYQLPSIVLSGLTVVVSPLIALMQDQVDAAKQNGLAAAFLNSSLAPDEAERVWRSVHDGTTRLLYVSPERLALEGFRGKLRELNVSLFAIDEAHCISEWGHDFRPDYRSLAVIRAEFPSVPIAAFTATATRHVQDDVIRILGLHEPVTIRGDFDRKEIFYRVQRKEKVAEQIVSFVKQHRDEPGIVYRATRKSVDTTTAKLAATGISAARYHAGLSDDERRANQAAFVRDEVQVVVATIAFGMGIDKSNVRWVVHGDMPRSLEAYYQETGRAGRDGEPAEARLFFGPQDIATARYHIDRMELEQERERAEGSLRDMLRFVDAGVCRRTQLLAHFDQDHTGECAGCDICAGDVRTVDRTVPAQMAMSAMVRTGERFGAHHIADIVVGTTTERVEQFGHNEIPTFGVGAEHSRAWWIRLMQDLEAAGLVLRRDGAKSGFSLSAAGRSVLTGKETFIAIERDDAEIERQIGGRKRRSNAPEPSDVPDDDAEALFACLRLLRRTLARQQGVPPYVIFSDKTLRGMARLRPVDESALLDVHGVGETKAARYGAAFLTAITEFASSGECRDDAAPTNDD
ncbi:MAG: DNA helicase RecQ [Spirochaetaceae bacterium]|nr:MAG: DNA helicase RecQ [Spirochaetaceae bacterium]